jgi:hypothetical protein
VESLSPRSILDGFAVLFEENPGFLCSFCWPTGSRWRAFSRRGGADRRGGIRQKLRRVRPLLPR